MNAPITRKLRCAVYTRKSSEEGLEQEFNSLHAQREACEAFIASQRNEGWVLVRDQYDDGGVSGGTLERPGLKRLVSEIEDGLVRPDSRAVVAEEGGIDDANTARLGDLHAPRHRSLVEVLRVVLEGQDVLETQIVRLERAALLSPPIPGRLSPDSAITRQPRLPAFEFSQCAIRVGRDRA